MRLDTRLYRLQGSSVDPTKARGENAAGIR
jgi:hypothetical protein